MCAVTLTLTHLTLPYLTLTLTHLTLTLTHLILTKQNFTITISYTFGHLINVGSDLTLTYLTLTHLPLTLPDLSYHRGYEIRIFEAGKILIILRVMPYHSPYILIKSKFKCLLVTVHKAVLSDLRKILQLLPIKSFVIQLMCAVTLTLTHPAKAQRANG